jgi:hypothetical protein
MPNFSGKWSQNQILYNDLGFYKVPGAPTSVSATNGNTESVVSFTAPTYTGLPAEITGYKVTASTGGSIVATVTGSASPLTITGLTNGTTYDIAVQAQNFGGYGNAGTTTATPAAPSQVEYTTAGSYTFVVPAGLNPATVSWVCVGGGGSYGSYQNGGCGGGGGGLGFKNNYSVSAGQSLQVEVGARATTEPGQGGNSYVVNTGTAYGGGGYSGSMNGANGTGGSGGAYNGDGGGNGGTGGPGSSGGSLGPRAYGSGGGAGGYSGAGGTGNYYGNATGSYENYGGTSGAGGAAAGGWGGYAGGGVGLLGEGSSGTIGSNGTSGGSGGNNNNDGNSSNYGKVGGGRGSNSAGGWAHGGVRIIYSFNGTARTFPSTNTGDL